MSDPCDELALADDFIPVDDDLEVSVIGDQVRLALDGETVWTERVRN